MVFSDFEFKHCNYFDFDYFQFKLFSGLIELVGRMGYVAEGYIHSSERSCAEGFDCRIDLHLPH